MLSFLVVFRRLFQALRRGWADPQFRGLLYLALGLLVAGMFFYHRVEDWTLFEAFYFSSRARITSGPSAGQPTSDRCGFLKGVVRVQRSPSPIP